MTFSDQDIKQITEHGLTLKNVQQQIQDFESGFPFLDILRPATLGDGVIQYSDETIEKFVNIYDEYAKSHKILKFVPASGAATRMFKDLFDFMSTNIENFTTSKTFNNIDKFAFWDKLKTYLPKNFNSMDMVKNLLTESGLNYGNQPKGLIIFHKYSDGCKTAVEEHLIEGALYAKSDDTVYIHFTISPEHEHGFKDLLNNVLPIYQNKYGVKYNISMSEQKNSTDTIAVNMDNTPFRNSDGSLLFRPAGHGALIENLNDIDADLIFIKNIDNVTNDSLRKDTIRYKKMLAGTLISLQSEIFDLMRTNDPNKLHNNK